MQLDSRLFASGQNQGIEEPVVPGASRLGQKSLDAPDVDVGNRTGRRSHDEESPGQREVRDVIVDRGVPSLEGLFQNRLRLLLEVDGVAVARHVNVAGDEALEDIAAGEQRHTLALLQEQNPSCHLEEIVVRHLEEFVAREHILVSSGGFIGITDEGLAALGLSRRVCASTTHFAALPYLLKGSQAVATIPAHAAQSIAALSSLALLPCPLALPRYPIELGWRTSTQLDPVVLKVREAIVASFAQELPKAAIF